MKIIARLFLLPRLNKSPLKHNINGFCQDSQATGVR